MSVRRNSIPRLWQKNQLSCILAMFIVVPLVASASSLANSKTHTHTDTLEHIFKTRARDILMNCRILFFLGFVLFRRCFFFVFISNHFRLLLIHHSSNQHQQPTKAAAIIITTIMHNNNKKNYNHIVLNMYV